MKIDASGTDCGVLELVFRGFMDQFRFVYAQIWCQMTYFSVWVQSVTGFCVEPEILDLAQLISTGCWPRILVYPPPKPILVITLGRALLRFDQRHLIFTRKFTNFPGICVFRRFQDFWSLVWDLTNVKRLRRDNLERSEISPTIIFQSTLLQNYM